MEKKNGVETDGQREGERESGKEGIKRNIDTEGGQTIYVSNGQGFEDHRRFSQPTPLLWV